MKALPKEFVETWQRAACDPDGKVEYLLRPLSHRLRIQVVSEAVKGEGRRAQVHFGTGSFNVVGLALKGIRGLVEPDATGPEGEDLPFELEFDTIKVLGVKHEKVTYACLERLPRELFDEISSRVGNVTPDSLEEEVDFTLGSSQTSDSDTVTPATETTTGVVPSSQ